MMRILHINCNYTNNEVHRLLIQQLNLLNLKNTVYVPVSDNSKFDKQEGVVISKCFHKRDRFWFSYKQRKIYRDFRKNIDIKSYDILHAYTLFTDGNCAYKVYKRYNIPYVVAIRNTDINYFLKYRFWLRKRGIEIIKHAKAVFFLSKTYMNRFFDLYIPASLREVISKKCFVIPNGINDFWLNNKLKHAKKLEFSNVLKILYVGKVDKEKNLKLTARAINMLEREDYDIQYTVVGEIMNKSVYTELTKMVKVKHLAFSPKEDLLYQYRENDIFVMPSLHESFGMVYIEAMTQGLPVIYTRNEGFDNQFKEGEVGYSVDCYRPEELVDAIKKIILDYKAISFRCLERVNKYEWANIANEYYAIYKRIGEEINGSKK